MGSPLGFLWVQWVNCGPKKGIPFQNIEIVQKTVSKAFIIKTYKYIKNDILFGDIMPRLQKGPEGRFLMTIPKKLVEAKGWVKGNDIACLIIGPNIVPREGDVILRPSGS